MGETIRRNLPVCIREHEALAKSKQLGSLVQEMDRVEEERKEIASQYRERLESMKDQVSELARAVRDGIELREVECVERRDESRMVMLLIRTDTNEAVEVRPMTESERQIVLFPDLSPPIPAAPRQGKSAAAGGDDEPF